MAPFPTSIQLPPATGSGPTPTSKPLNIGEPQELGIDKVTAFWEGYNKVADLDDREFVKSLSSSLDTLLIFAGLFAGVNTAFIMESLHTIQPDHAEKANELMRSIIHVLQNETSDDLFQEEPFQAPAQAVRYTITFFVSLSFALAAAFGAMICKQWLIHYERERELKPPPQRAVERHKKYNSRQQWHLRTVIELLPNIIQISLFLFLIALVDFLWAVRKNLAITMLSFSLLPVLFYFVTTTIAIIYPDSPFQSGLSISLRHSIPELARWLSITAQWLYKGVLGYQPHRLLRHVYSLMLLMFVGLCYIPWSIYQLFSFGISKFISHVRSPARNALKLDPNILLNMKCLIYYIERASTPEDMEAIFAALDALRRDLQRLPEPDQNHPIISSLFQAIHRFVLKPEWDSQKKRVIWGTGSIDLQPLLNFFHLVYVDWRRYLEFSSLGNPGSDPNQRSPEGKGVQQTIRQQLWIVHSRDELDFHSMVLLEAVMEETRPPVEDCPDLNIELLCESLTRPSPENHYYLPYIYLLSHAPFRRLAAYSERQKYSSLTTLLSEMSVDENPVLDYRLDSVRACWLAARVRFDSADGYEFATLLSQWYNAHREHPSFVRWYLQALVELLYSYPNNAFWPQELREKGHQALLFDIVQLGRNVPLAFSCLVMLHDRRTTPSNQPYQNPEYVNAVVMSWRQHAVITDLKRMGVLDGPRIVTLLTGTARYLREASQARLLKKNMEFIAKEFKEEGDIYLGGDPVLQRRLYEMIDGLVFL